MEEPVNMPQEQWIMETRDTPFAYKGFKVINCLAHIGQNPYS